VRILPDEMLAEGPLPYLPLQPTPHAKIYCGDVRKVLREQLAPESVKIVMTSPPYWGLRDYQTEPVLWDGGTGSGCCGGQQEQEEHEFQTRRYLLHSGRDDAQKSGKYSEQEPIPDIEMQDELCTKCGAWRGQLGQEPTIDMYVDHLMQIFDEIWRVLRPDGTLWVNFGDTYSSSRKGSGGSGLQGDNVYARLKKRAGFNPRKFDMSGILDKSLSMIPERWAIAMIDRGWILRNKIVWHKPNSMPSSTKDRFSVDWEYLFFFAKKERYYFNTQYEPYQSTPKDLEERSRFGGDKAAGYGSRLYSGNVWEPIHNDTDDERIMGGGRIKRCVWTIPTQAYSDHHYATYPVELCETPIKAGCPEYVCKKCGKARQIKVKEITFDTRPGLDIGNRKSGGLLDPNAGLHNSELSVKRQKIKRLPESLTDCCGCGAGWRPGMVLDPFAGSGAPERAHHVDGHGRRTAAHRRV
jgi:DNA modification methylase